MATQAYVTELQAAPQPSQPPQAQPQPPPPPPAAPQPPQPPATPQPQYVTELQNPQPQAQPPGSQKQYVTDLPAAPTPSQPAGGPTPSPGSQQYIVVTVSGKWACAQSQGALRGVLGSPASWTWGHSDAPHHCRLLGMSPAQQLSNSLGFSGRSGGHLWGKESGQAVRPLSPQTSSHQGSS